MQMDIFKAETPAKLTSNGGLTYTLCITPACGAESLLVYISPNLNVSALLFHSDQRINLPETQGTVSTGQHLVLYQSSAYPRKWPGHSIKPPSQIRIK